MSGEWHQICWYTPNLNKCNFWKAVFGEECSIRILPPCNYCHHPWCVGGKSYHKALIIMFSCDGISDHASWNEVFHYWDTKFSWIQHVHLSKKKFKPIDLPLGVALLQMYGWMNGRLALPSELLLYSATRLKKSNQIILCSWLIIKIRTLWNNWSIDLLAWHHSVWYFFHKWP